MIVKTSYGYKWVKLTENTLPAGWASRPPIEKAIAYAEEHGVCEFHVKGSEMIYYTSFPCEHTTYKATVNLDTVHETREPLKKYYKAYSARVGGKYQSNYMA